MLPLKLLHQFPSNLGVRVHHLTLLVGLGATGLAKGIPSGNALQDDGKPIGTESVSPGKVWAGIPAGDLRVPGNELIAGGQAGRSAWLEALVGAPNGHGLCARSGDEGRQDIVQVGERVANGAHFPVENANDARLRLVEDDIVNLVVAVDERGAVLGLCLCVAEKGHHVVLVRDLAYGFASLLVLGRGLRLRYRVEGGDLAIVEARRLAVRSEIYRSRVDAVETGQGSNGGVPPVKDAWSITSLIRCVCACVSLRVALEGRSEYHTFLSAPRE